MPDDGARPGGAPRPSDGASPDGAARPGPRRAASAVRSALVWTTAALGVAGMIAVSSLVKGLIVVALIGIGIYLGDLVGGSDGRGAGGAIGCVVALVLFLMFDGPTTRGGAGNTR